MYIHAHVHKLNIHIHIPEKVFLHTGCSFSSSSVGPFCLRLPSLVVRMWAAWKTPSRYWRAGVGWGLSCLSRDSEVAAILVIEVTEISAVCCWFQSPSTQSMNCHLIRWFDSFCAFSLLGWGRYFLYSNSHLLTKPQIIHCIQQYSKLFSLFPEFPNASSITVAASSVCLDLHVNSLVTSSHLRYCHDLYRIGTTVCTCQWYNLQTLLVYWDLLQDSPTAVHVLEIIRQPNF